MASGAPLATRLVVPHRPPDLLHRGRLVDALSSAAELPLALVAAPAGAGKSSLIGDWVRAGAAPGPVAWVGLDGEPVGRSEFWTLVFAAVERALGDAGAFAKQGPVDPALVAFLNRLADEPRPVVLVLDDFQEVADEAIASDLDALLQHPPPALRVLIASRRDPPLRLGRLRVAGQVGELRARDLAFTEDEAVAFLTAALPQLGATDAAALWRRTEGWAAGLRMAALSLRGHPDPSAFLAEFTGGDAAVTDYLLSEVLDRQEARERGLLLRTSIVEELCGELADALTGGTDGDRALRRLAHENAMLEPCDGRPGWFRFHPLLRDLLRAELRSELGGEVPELHRRAARWFAGRGAVLAATHHALAAGDVELASRAVARGWVELFLDGGIATLRTLVASLPAETIEHEPELALAAAAVHIEDGELALATAALDAASSEIGRVPPDRRNQFEVTYGTVVLRRARLHGHLAEGLAEARRWIGADVAAVETPGLAGLALASTGIAELWAGDRDLAVGRLEAALGVADRSGQRYVAATALAHLALDDSFAGRHRRAFERSAAAIAILEGADWTRTSAAAAAYGVRAGIEYLWDQPGAARRSLDRASDALEAAPERALRALVATNRIRVLAALGEADAAYATLRFERLALGDFSHHHLDAILAAQEGILLEALGEREEARTTLRRALGAEGAPEVRVALGRLLLADGEPHEAIELVRPVTSGDHTRQLLSTRVQAHGVHALACDSLLDHDGASAALARALDLAEPRGLGRMLSELGPSLRPVLNRELRRETAHRALVQDVLEAIDGAARSGPRARHPFEPLSDRELTILRFLPTMMSNQEIADELYVSVNTLKTHLKHIYRKLDVASRRDAVDRARAMELLSPSGRDPR